MIKFVKQESLFYKGFCFTSEDGTETYALQVNDYRTTSFSSVTEFLDMIDMLDVKDRPKTLMDFIRVIPLSEMTYNDLIRCNAIYYETMG